MKHWIAPLKKDTANVTLEKRPRKSAEEFRVNSGLKEAKYSAPVLGLIFLRFVDAWFTLKRPEFAQAGASSRRGSRVDALEAYYAEKRIRSCFHDAYSNLQFNLNLLKKRRVPTSTKLTSGMRAYKICAI